MFRTMKHVLIAVGTLLILLAFFKLTQNYYREEIRAAKQKTKVQLLRNSKLVKVAEGQYEKLVADTLTKNQLKRIVDSLKIKVDNPVIVERIIIKYKDVQTAIEDITVQDSIVQVVDYYPNKSNPYITHRSKVNTLTKKGTGDFSFGKLPISVVVSEEDGIYKASLKAPDFVELENFDFQATPLEPVEKDNWGTLLGAGYIQNFTEKTHGIGISGGIRYRKIYLLGTVQTNSTAGLTLLIEF